ncbi:MAG: hypothetical protein ACREQF_03260 [Candidatus Binataceae bacterium]
MSGANLRWAASVRSALIWPAIAAAALACAACRSAPDLKLHYLPGFVPGSMNVFRPVGIGVMPVAGEMASGRIQVGAVYRTDGTIERKLFVHDVRDVVTAAIAQCLEGAGLRPAALDASRADGALPDGVDFVLRTELTALTSNKRFGDRDTVHGKYFTMDSVVQLKFVVQNRDGQTLLTVESSGTQREPPAPVGKEEFLPLETEPAESLSIALSKSVGALILDPKFREIFPLRDSAPGTEPARSPR